MALDLDAAVELLERYHETIAVEDSAVWQEKGKKAFLGGQYAKAYWSYTTSITALLQRPSISDISFHQRVNQPAGHLVLRGLLKVAEVCHELQQQSEACLFSIAALVLDHVSVPAKHRLALSLYHLPDDVMVGSMTQAELLEAKTNLIMRTVMEMGPLSAGTAEAHISDSGCKGSMDSPLRKQAPTAGGQQGPGSLPGGTAGGVTLNGCAVVHQRPSTCTAMLIAQLASRCLLSSVGMPHPGCFEHGDMEEGHLEMVEADQLLEDGEMEDALECYLSSLAHLGPSRKKLSLLLTNRAACCIQMGETPLLYDAVIDSVV